MLKQLRKQNVPCVVPFASGTTLRKGQKTFLCDSGDDNNHSRAGIRCLVDAKGGLPRSIDLPNPSAPSDVSLDSEDLRHYFCCVEIMQELL